MLLLLQKRVYLKESRKLKTLNWKMKYIQYITFLSLAQYFYDSFWCSRFDRWAIFTHIITRRIRNSYHYSCPRCKSVLLIVSVTTIDAFAWYFRLFCDWLKIIFAGETFTKKTLNDPQWRRVYSKQLSCCTDELSHGFWPSLNQGGTRKRKTKGTCVKILKDW